MYFTLRIVFVDFLPSSRIGKGKSVPGMFDNLSAVLGENEEGRLLDPLLKTEITQHLRFLESELNMYFQNSRRKKGSW